MASNSDVLSLLGLYLMVNIGVTCWGKVKQQPISLTIHLHNDIEEAGASDNVKDTINYSDVLKDVTEFTSAKDQFDGLHTLAIEIAIFILRESTRCNAVHIVITAPKQILCADGLQVDAFRKRTPGSETYIDKVTIQNLHILAIIGVNPPERSHKQRLSLSITFHVSDKQPSFDYPAFSKLLVEYTESSEYLTLEAFSVAAIYNVFDALPDPKDGSLVAIALQVHKPSAVITGEASALTITRDLAWFLARKSTSTLS